MKQFTSEIAKAFVLTSFSALSTLAVAPAQAVVLDFESLAHADSSTTPIGSTYTEKGFTITGGQLSTFGTLESRYPGSTALFDDAISANIQLAQVGGGAFTLSSIDLTSLNGDYSVPVTFTGTRADTTTVSQIFTTDASLKTLETFNFTNFTNLTNVNWTQDSPFHQFDNININGATSTAVPEPFTVVGTIIGGTAAFRMRKKLKAIGK